MSKTVQGQKKGRTDLCAEPGPEKNLNELGSSTSLRIAADAHAFDIEGVYVLDWPFTVLAMLSWFKNVESSLLATPGNSVEQVLKMRQSATARDAPGP
jgi:hypothetical protein